MWSIQICSQETFNTQLPSTPQWQYVTNYTYFTNYTDFTDYTDFLDCIHVVKLNLQQVSLVEQPVHKYTI